MHKKDKFIPFNKPPYTGVEESYVLDAIRSNKLSGDGDYTKKCQHWFDFELGSQTLMVSSCTHALEVSALIIGVKPGDEVIMPSYTFVSTANAFVMRGAKIIFVDIDPATLNLDIDQVEQAITSRTKAIVAVHYAGISCDMDRLVLLALRHQIFLIEDAAQAIFSTYKGKPLGTFGQIAAFSFHETKNVTSGGEGGLLIVNDPTLFQSAEIFREKGTNRNKFFRGEVDKYSWLDIGSSYLASELQAAYLWGQLTCKNELYTARLEAWNYYMDLLSKILPKESLPYIPRSNSHNGHIFYIKAKNLDERSNLLYFLKENGVGAVFHYVPLHTSVAGKKYGRFHGVDQHTTLESERVVRLPLFHGISKNEIKFVVDKIKQFYD